MIAIILVDVLIADLIFAVPPSREQTHSEEERSPLLVQVIGFLVITPWLQKMNGSTIYLSSRQRRLRRFFTPPLCLNSTHVNL